MPLQAIDSSTDAERDERRAFCGGLRELADVLERGVNIPLPSPNANAFPSSAKEFAAAVREIPGRLDKRTWGESMGTPHMEVSRKFGPITFSLSTPRSKVCTPKVIGTEKVEVEEVVKPAVTEKKLVERDVIQWECEPLLGCTGEDAA